MCACPLYQLIDSLCDSSGSLVTLDLAHCTKGLVAIYVYVIIIYKFNNTTYIYIYIYVTQEFYVFPSMGIYEYQWKIHYTNRFDPAMLQDFS